MLLVSMFLKVKVLSPSADPAMQFLCRSVIYPIPSLLSTLLLRQIKKLDSETKACIEYTGRYYEPAVWFLYGPENCYEINLISLLDQTYHGANDFFDSPARSNSSQKWCKRNGYNFSTSKAEKIYQGSSDLIAVFLKDDNIKTLIRQTVTMLNASSQTMEVLGLKIDQTATTLPEYPPLWQ